MKNRTFLEDLKAYREGELKVPKVSTAKGRIDFFAYQIAVSKYKLGIMSIGLKCRDVKFTDIKKYYELKGRSAKDCKPQLDQMLIDYKNGLI